MLEASACNAVEMYPWGNEYWRAECERGTLVLDHRMMEAFRYDPTLTGNRRVWGEGTPVPLVVGFPNGHAVLIEQFLQWLDGGDPMPTNVEDNLQSVALFEAAIVSSRTAQPVRVQKYLADVRQKATGLR